MLAHGARVQLLAGCQLRLQAVHLAAQLRRLGCQAALEGLQVVVGLQEGRGAAMSWEDRKLVGRRTTGTPEAEDRPGHIAGKGRQFADAPSGTRRRPAPAPPAPAAPPAARSGPAAAPRASPRPAAAAAPAPARQLPPAPPPARPCSAAARRAAARPARPAGGRRPPAPPPAAESAPCGRTGEEGYAGGVRWCGIHSLTALTADHRSTTHT